MFRDTQSRPRTTRSSICLKVGSMWESRRAGRTSQWELDTCWGLPEGQVRIRIQRTMLWKNKKHYKVGSWISSQTDKKLYKTVTLLLTQFHTIHTYHIRLFQFFHKGSMRKKFISPVSPIIILGSSFIFNLTRLSKVWQTISKHIKSQWVLTIRETVTITWIVSPYPHIRNLKHREDNRPERRQT